MACCVTWPMSLSRAAMAALPVAPITFNYLGQFDQSFGADALFRPLDEASRRGPRSAMRRCPTELSVDSQVYGGELVLRWTFSAERYDRRPSANWPMLTSANCRA